jgi:hypothetical protein
MLKRFAVALPILALLILSSPSPVQAEKPKPTPLVFNAHADGELAELLLFRLRTKLVASTLFRSPYKNDEKFSLYVTAKEAPPADGTMTVFTYVVGFIPNFKTNPDLSILVTFNTGFCGASMLDSCAENIIVGTYRGVRSFRGNGDGGDLRAVHELKKAEECAASKSDDLPDSTE